MTYEYACSSCGHEWEAEQSISEQPLKKCPSCKKNSAKRQISGGTGFLLKGGGWYADRYGAPAAKSAEKSESSESSSDSPATGKDSKLSKAEGKGKSATDKSAKGKASDDGGGTKPTGPGTKAAE